MIGIFIDTMALGDTIAAIPTCKKIAIAYDTEEVHIITNHPYLFEGHPDFAHISKPENTNLNNFHKVHRLFSPLVGKSYQLQGGETIEWRYSNMDIRQFHAVSQGFTLSEHEMETDLYIERERELPVSSYVIIHPTYTWATRTWDQEKWQELADRLNDLGIPVVAVGRSSKEQGFFNVDKPIMDINIRIGVNLLDDPTNDVAELRWMMNHRARCVITMDSGILHVAGTTDVNIIQLGSSIDPKLRAPYRKGSQSYKYQFVRGGCDILCSSNMKYNVKVHGSIHGVPPQVYCLENKPTFECHPSVEHVFEAVLSIQEKKTKYEKAFITHCDEGYLPIVEKMVETIREFSHIPVIVYVLNSDKKVNGINVDCIRWECDIREGQTFLENEDGQNTYIDRKSQRIYDILTQKPAVAKHALITLANNIVYIDGDSVATHRIDELFDYISPNMKHPLFTFSVQDYMMIDGEGNPFICDSEGNQIGIDLTRTLEFDVCKLFNADIENRNYYGSYIQTGYFVATANSKCIAFLNVWNGMCENEEVKNNINKFAPFHEETLANVLLWKHNLRDKLPLVYINANSLEIIDRFYLELIDAFEPVQRFKDGVWFTAPGNKKDLKVFHGEKRPEVIDEMILRIKQYQYAN